MADDVPRTIRENRVMVIYRGQTPEQCLEFSAGLHAAGIRLFEVTLNGPDPFTAITALHDAYGGALPIGAGTVLTADDVARAADAGARIIVSPNVDEAVIARTKALGLVSVPGAFTPTEIVRAVDLGADVVKVFPIRPVGADYIRQLRGPLPDVPMMATGGVDADLAGACMQAGCTAVGVGIQLFGERALAGDPEALAAGARRMLDAAAPG
ncbi:2-keto-3-deoxy-phosphogalactonate aldolase [Murinocardiopsis flavida]|uniref:2-keto-3-deoxy-phosphogalactonate aldolase n=1 Tax=Murinocardiopsis flavida TaxID=645275 RepID=A0A2P8DFA9_9ACTN|nr:bifunctional 4-hydroxy-2-oxoglutarate aldolase/2-dehydro-3-deoxy-phosphogluconate aldolase [Murinocardiopsis flavida]PSK95887.1 2-keto-3-deoxy-phosphogalactonate aldolase [Murinocardiopsis flavida]